MNLVFQQRMQTLYQQFIAFDALQTERTQRYRNIEPESALFLAMQIRVQQSKKILEIGTSTGYSTLWLANAAQETQGQITTLEIEPDRTAQAQQYAQELGLDHVIDFRIGDAQAFLNNNLNHYDFILLDAERDAYCDYWNALQHILKAKGGLLVVDNVLSHASEVEGFLNLVRENLNFNTTTLAVGAGLFLATRN